MGHCDFVINGPNFMVVTCERGTIHSHCRASGCRKLASLACMFVVRPRNAEPRDCGMKLCEEHALAVEGRLCCPPHFKLVTRALNR